MGVSSVKSLAPLRLAQFFGKNFSFLFGFGLDGSKDLGIEHHCIKTIKRNHILLQEGVPAQNSNTYSSALNGRAARSFQS